MKLSSRTALLAAAAALLAQGAHAFCGFYVAKADTKLYNKASKVVLVRHDDKTVLTMANDFQGDPKEFAVVIPVPTVIRRQQINVAENALIDHLDSYTAPRLVEYFDPDPCQMIRYRRDMGASSQKMVGAISPSASAEAASLGVKIEAEYTVGEYDIVILSAEQSDGLETWLTSNGYNIPEGASRVLGSYIKQDMRFFVAKVNLEEQSKLGFSYLRPLQVAYESPKFMLPIRLGTVNADGPQELFVMAITRAGRVEATNYRTVKLPTGMDLPPFIKENFKEFYKAMFDEQVKKHGMRTVFLEYAWNMSWCDPCAADPLTSRQLRQLGCFWIARDGSSDGGGSPSRPRRSPPILPGGGSQEAFVTRLHVRYTAETFPEDLFFQETGDSENFQGRYVLRHPWKGESSCPEAREYRRALRVRQDKEAQELASLTGWSVDRIRRKAGIASGGGSGGGGDDWYSDLWDNEDKKEEEKEDAWYGDLWGD